MKIWRYLLAIGVILGLSGCANLLYPTSTGEGSRVAHARWVEAHPDWAFWGQFALDIDQHGWTAAIFWRERGLDYHIDISGPFGRTLAQLQGTSTQVILRARNKPPHTAISAQDLMHSELGWSLPVAGMRYWVRGIPAPASVIKKIRYDNQGRVVLLQQAGWHIDYLAYHTLGIQSRPKRIRMVHGNVRLILVIDRWQNS